MEKKNMANGVTTVCYILAALSLVGGFVAVFESPIYIVAGIAAAVMFAFMGFVADKVCGIHNEMKTMNDRVDWIKQTQTNHQVVLSNILTELKKNNSSNEQK